MKKYTVTFTENGQDVARDALAATIGARLRPLRPEGQVWRFSDTLTLRPDGEFSFLLQAELKDLFAFLSALFDVPDSQQTAATFFDPDLSDTTVVLHNDKASAAREIEMGTVRFVEANDILISFDIFQVTWPNLFRESEAAAADDPEYGTVRIAPETALILSGLSPVTPDNETQMIFILTQLRSTPVEVLGAAFGVSEAMEIDVDHYLFEDADSGRAIEALTFDSDIGPVLEIRLTVSDADTDQLLASVGARFDTREGVAYYIIEEDFTGMEFQARSVAPDGSLGPSISIKYEL